jgi:hypothetical protein
MATTTPESSGELTRIMKVVGGVGVILAAGAFGMYGVHAGFSVAVGAVIAVSNLWVLGKIIASALPEVEPTPSNKGGDAKADGKANANANADADADANANADANADAYANADAKGSSSRARRAAWTAFAFVKILVLFGGIWMLMANGVASPLGLAVGYGSLFIGIGLSTMLSSMRIR